MMRPVKALSKFSLAAALSLGLAQAAFANDFEATLRSIWPEARAKGVSAEVFNAALAGAKLDQSILEKAAYQPEFTRPIWEYIDRAVSSSRIENGQAKKRQYLSTLEAIERQFGVDYHILLAIWGVESSYGAVLDNKSIVVNVPHALATLAHAGPRNYKSFGRTQLVAALQILQAGDVPVGRMTGSWAGAMGHTQFIPTSYLAFAVDFTGDGKRDIWNSVEDALASSASLLQKNGWVAGKTWGYEVDLPRGFNYGLGDGKTKRSLTEWRRMGITRTGGREFPRPEDEAFLLLPAGAKGPAFLMLKNFDVIKRYNNATSYALAVGHLADRIRGGGGFQNPWPVGEQTLNRKQVIALQNALNRKGFNVGKADGKVGPATMAGIRAYQASRNMTPDGFPTMSLLQDVLR